METKNNSIPIDKILILISFLALFIYIAIRAYTLSFVHDESLSFTIIKGSPQWIHSANHHFINTTLMSWCSDLFGDSEFSLRLPNVLSFGFYLSAAFLLLHSSKNKWNILLATLFIFNPFVLEFFSLARGYGLSLGFMLMSTYFFIRNGLDFKSSKSFLIDFSCSVLFAGLATHSNLPMINFLIAILVLTILKFGYYLYLSKERDFKFIISFVTLFIVASIPLYHGIQRLLFLNETNQLYVGSKSMVESLDLLITSSIYRFKDQQWIALFIRYTILFSIPISVASIILKKDYFGKLAIITILNITIITGLLLEHYLFGANFPSGRTTLVFIPIFGLMFYYFNAHLSSHYHIRKGLHNFILICFATPLLINFTSSINTTYTTVWRYDAHTKDAMLSIHEKTKNLEQKASISNHWLFQPTMDYYILSRKINVNLTNRNGVHHNSDFIYQLDVNPPIQSNYKSIKEYKDIKSNLLIKNQF